LRFIGFALVGTSGILVNQLFVFLVTDKLHIYYLFSGGIATVASLCGNFGLTEALVYRTKNRRMVLPADWGCSLNEHDWSLRTPMITL